MKIISLKEVALTGKFGDVKIGMTYGEVCEHLGDPDGYQRFKRYSGVAMYSWFEFFYRNGVLYGIQNDHFDSVKSGSFRFQNEFFKIDPWIFKPSPPGSAKKLAKALNDQQVTCNVIDYFGRTCVFFPTQFLIDFDKSLVGFRFFPELKIEED